MKKRTKKSPLKKPPSITAAEWEVLDILWKRDTTR
jgi:predicted transcriptional regulator